MAELVKDLKVDSEKKGHKGKVIHIRGSYASESYTFRNQATRIALFLVTEERGWARGESDLEHSFRYIFVERQNH